jgi:acetyl esterase
MGARMDPAVEAALMAMPPLQFADPAAQRLAFAEQAKQMPKPPPDERTMTEKLVVPRGEPQGVPVRVFRPRDATGSLPVVVWIHGGAYVVGSASQDDLLCSDLAVRTGTVVVSVDYRLAPEHPYPAALDDCYAATCWAAAGGVESTDPSRLAIAGASAGAGLAAAVALYARDHGGPLIVFQLLLYPYLDDRRDTPSHRTGHAAPLFTAVDAEHGWRHYLRGLTDGNGIPPYASPARAAALDGLPPAYVLAAGMDCLRDEAVNYAMAMAQAGVAVELHLVPAVPHGFDAVAPDAAVSRRVIAEYASALRRGVDGPGPGPGLPLRPGKRPRRNEDRGTENDTADATAWRGGHGV